VRTPNLLRGAGLIILGTVILYMLRGPLVRFIMTVLEILGVVIAIGLVAAGIGLLVKGVLD
jgi:hypothetical protein